ncbi:hypothetical protein GPECTOR_17g890 [Gonium pectorale]|uniref:Exostosin GT47 domain-containing protein n=1 Tax=Gonium pectorale TaxID=33097 RepID=A0A150GKC9_GONPE|nr:hypothetical protein GPECTOR_17g890 [Gonium pectorale]|eukprot:KXZ50252.1 hypothetical protein GPECTOR_17g890 [Gonium pectorale]
MSSLRPGAVPQYGVRFPKNCWCYRQLMRLACAGEFWADPFLCRQPAFWMWEEIRCYEYAGVPETDQRSDPPEPGKADVVWRKGVRKNDVKSNDSFAFEQLPGPHASGLLPMDKCKDRPIHFPIYLAEIDVYHRILGDTAIRTENPWEANLFFIPTHTYYYIGNVGFPGLHFGAVFRHVREAHPWWNLTAGRNHVAATSNDRGCCDLYRLGLDVQRPIKLVHFAQAPRHSMLLSKNPGGGDSWREKPEDLAARLRSNMEDPAMLGAIAEFQHLAGRPRFRGFPIYELPALQQEREICYRPEHDVAFPPYLSSQPNHGAWLSVIPRAYGMGPDGKPFFLRESKRGTLLYFNGYSKVDMAYSAGVRQGLLALFKDNPREDLNINRVGGVAAMLSSRFCFTPMGFGWGIRLSQAMLAGCVPVMTHDHTWPTLWDVLPYERFSVRVSRHNLHRLLDLIESITPEQLAKLQDGLAEYYRAFVWQTEAGGLAYNYTMLSLHRRLLNMWTGMF